MDASILDGPWPYLLLLALSIGESSAFLGLVVPGETFVLAAGALAAAGELSMPWLILVVVVGAVLGDFVGYVLGRRVASANGTARSRRVLSQAREERMRRFFQRWGSATVFVGRFVGFVRPLAPVAAGLARMRLRTFVTYNVAGALIWGTGSLYAGYFIGESAETLLRTIGWAGAGVVAAAVVLAVVLHRRRRARHDVVGVVETGRAEQRVS